MLKEGDRVMALGAYRSFLLENTISAVGPIVHCYTDIFGERRANVEFRTAHSAYSMPLKETHLCHLPSPKEHTS